MDDLGNYLLFIPLLIYGTALSEIIGQWKLAVIINKKNIHYLFTIIAITELAIANIYNYFSFFNRDPSHHYLNYLGYLLPPLLLQATIHMYPPATSNPEDATIKFNNSFPYLFLVMACYIAVHMLPQFSAPVPQFTLLKLLGMGACLLVFFVKSKWTLYVFYAVWFFGLIVKFLYL